MAPEWLSNLPHKWEDDPRDPIVTFSWADTSYGLYLPDIIQNIEIALVRLLPLEVLCIGFLISLSCILHSNKDSLTFRYLLALLLWQQLFQ